MLREQERNSCLLDAQPSWGVYSVPPPAHPIWEVHVQAKAERCTGHRCPRGCAGPRRGEHLGTHPHLFRAAEEQLW